MWNMTKYKCKLKISRLGHEPCIIVPKIFFLLSNRRRTPQVYGKNKKIGSVGLVETKIIFTPKQAIGVELVQLLLF